MSTPAVADVDLLPFLTLPPAPQPGICATCRGVDYDDAQRCANCREIAGQLAADLVPAWPASAYKKPSRFRDQLTHYKPNAEGPADLLARPLLSEVLRQFVQAIPPTIIGPVDFATTVPSTVPKDSPHPLLEVARLAVMPLPVYRTLMRGAGDLGHGRASRAAYSVIDPAMVQGKRLMLIDDVYTTGARAQSAAYALLDGGAASVRLIVIARRFNLEYHERVRQLWSALSTEPYSFAAAASTLSQVT